MDDESSRVSREMLLYPVAPSFTPMPQTLRSSRCTMPIHIWACLRLTVPQNHRLSKHLFRHLD